MVAARKGPATVLEPAAIVTALLLERPLCTDCLIARSGLDHTAIEACLETIQGVLRIERQTSARCHACGNIGQVVALKHRPP